MTLRRITKKKKAKFVDNCLTFLVELKETFKSLLLMHTLFAIGCIPGFEVFISLLVIGFFNIILKSIKPFAMFFCSSCYLRWPDATEAWLAETTDLVRIWLLCIILITTIRFAYHQHMKQKDVSNVAG